VAKASALRGPVLRLAATVFNVANSQSVCAVRLFTQLFGVKRELPVSRVNINPERSTPTYPISPEDRSHLLELNRADVAWYDRACEIFSQTFTAQFGSDPIPDAAVRNFLAAEEKDRVAVA
jgi:hypothetical protein